MNAGELIVELQKFPELSTAFVQVDDGTIRRIDSVIPPHVPRMTDWEIKQARADAARSGPHE